MNGLPWQHHDGGRSAAPGFGGVSSARDCVCRAIAIVREAPYEVVYADLTALQKEWAHRSRAKRAKALVASGQWHAQHGVHREVIHQYLVGQHNWMWVPTMQIGSGTTVHMAVGELPMGRLVVSLSKHVAAVVDGVVYDTHDPCRDGTRAVYGYWIARN